LRVSPPLPDQTPPSSPPCNACYSSMVNGGEGCVVSREGRVVSREGRAVSREGRAVSRELYRYCVAAEIG
jgi:hypothetical protein